MALSIKLNAILQFHQQRNTAISTTSIDIATLYDLAKQNGISWRDWPQWLTEKIQSLLSVANVTLTTSTSLIETSSSSSIEPQEKGNLSNVTADHNEETDDFQIGYTLSS